MSEVSPGSAGETRGSARDADSRRARRVGARPRSRTRRGVIVASAELDFERGEPYSRSRVLPHARRHGRAIVDQGLLLQRPRPRSRTLARGSRRRLQPGGFRRRERLVQECSRATDPRSDARSEAYGTRATRAAIELAVGSQDRGTRRGAGSEIVGGRADAAHAGKWRGAPARPSARQVRRRSGARGSIRSARGERGARRPRSQRGRACPRSTARAGAVFRTRTHNALDARGLRRRSCGDCSRSARRLHARLALAAAAAAARSRKSSPSCAGCSSATGAARRASGARRCCSEHAIRGDQGVAERRRAERRGLLRTRERLE